MVRATVVVMGRNPSPAALAELSVAMLMLHYWQWVLGKDEAPIPSWSITFNKKAPVQAKIVE